MDCNKVIEALNLGNPVQENTIRWICKKAIELLIDESNLETVSAPAVVAGDVHGQFYDLLKLLQVGGPVPQSRYIFLGDYVDRGYHSLETVLLLLCLKIKHPSHIILLRGNHESRQISSMYGFYEEIVRKYGSPATWKLLNEVFDYLPISALIGDRIFCVHGGLSPDLRALDQIRDIDRVCQIPTSGAFGDLMWSDPQQVDTWVMGSRGVGWLFGARVVNDFNAHNGLDLVVRAHQLVQKGYKQWFANKNLVTLWSAPNYCYRCNNLGCILRVDENLNRSYETFTADERSSSSLHYTKLMPYFL